MMLGQFVRDKYLRTVIEWYIGMQHNWSVNTGIAGRRFKHYLDDKTWLMYTFTFARADIEEHWLAFFNAIGLFRELARIVGKNLGYEYPEQMDTEMTAYYVSIRDRKKEC
jgi:aminoglycoside 6-adenylyltransferase